MSALEEGEYINDRYEKVEERLSVRRHGFRTVSMSQLLTPAGLM
jgi:hypothetical protein